MRGHLRRHDRSAPRGGERLSADRLERLDVQLGLAAQHVIAREHAQPVK